MSSLKQKQAEAQPTTPMERGEQADLVLLDAAARWTVREEALISAGQCTPFAFQRSGLELPGKVLGTWVAGRRVFG